jgi:hypothetical protein
MGYSLSTLAAVLASQGLTMIRDHLLGHGHKRHEQGRPVE